VKFDLFANISVFISVLLSDVQTLVIRSIITHYSVNLWLWVRSSIPNTVESHHPPLRSVVALGYGVGRAGKPSNQVIFVRKTASVTLFDSRGGFSGSSYPMKT